MTYFQLSEQQVRTWINVRLPGHKRVGPDDYRGKCHRHQGDGDNFSVKPSTGQWFCHSQCQRGGHIIQLEAELSCKSTKEAIRAICELVGKSPPNGSKRLIQLEAYSYTDWDPENDCKTFKSRHRGADGDWIRDLEGVRLVPYRLHQIRESDHVLIVEGEKDVHTAEEWKFKATTNPFGAGKWRHEYSQFLPGDIFIIPDNDGPGRKHADDVRESVTRNGGRAFVVNLPIEKIGGDLTDWKQAGGTREQLEALMQEARNAYASVGTDRQASDERGHTTQPVSGLPDGFELVEKPHGRFKRPGLYRMTGNEPLWLSAPLDVVSLTRDAQNEDWGKEIEFRDRDGLRHTLTISDATLGVERSDFRTKLMRAGLEMAPGTKAAQAFREFLFQVDPKARSRRVLRWTLRLRQSVNPRFAVR